MFLLLINKSVAVYVFKTLVINVKKILIVVLTYVIQDFLLVLINVRHQHLLNQDLNNYVLEINVVDNAMIVKY